jgi:hypothetical protein
MEEKSLSGQRMQQKKSKIKKSDERHKKIECKLKPTQRNVGREKYSFY